MGESLKYCATIFRFRPIRRWAYLVTPWQIYFNPAFGAATRTDFARAVVVQRQMKDYAVVGYFLVYAMFFICNLVRYASLERAIKLNPLRLEARRSQATNVYRGSKVLSDEVGDV